MTEKITQLTPEQEILRDQWREKYFKIGWGTCTDRAEILQRRARAEKGILALYAGANLEVPVIIWFPSPIAAAIEIKKNYGGWAGLSGVDGCLDAYWAAFYTFCREIGVVYEPEDDKRLNDWLDIIESCGPCWPFANYCLMTDLPTVTSWDDNEVPHSDDGPAIAYGSGWAEATDGTRFKDEDGKEEFYEGHKVYFVHGIEVPEKVVMAPWDLTVEEIEGHDNEDVRTIMQECWCYEERDNAGDRIGSGGGRWLKETGAKTIDMDVYTGYRNPQGEDVQLQRALLVDKRNWKYLMCSDSSTDRVYYIRCDPKVKTCAEAHESINGGIKDADIVVSS